VACLGVLPDFSRALSPGLRHAGGRLVLVGAPRSSRLGGSQFAERQAGTGATFAPPLPTEPTARLELGLVLWANAQGLVSACHDVSDGGLAQALIEMAFASADGLGFTTHAAWGEGAPFASGHADLGWFDEAPGFVLEVAPAAAATLAAACEAFGVPNVEVGQVTADGTCTFAPAGGGTGAALPRADLKARWAVALHAAFATGAEAIL
jgi:phosphoribosylformylglycinamidine synthase